ncbi:hypothetical protein WISP_09642 [Willisornis vidua]|uniref:Uncharacterized protein n=1 Tax=Willisornis vidua TaxID=1566151 RepID=A0ABQ9DX95_9PASS|nr:hypothetical protein WISP_09642 [Willisornis vidua]
MPLDQVELIDSQDVLVQLQEASNSPAVILLKDFKHPKDWKKTTASSRQSRRLLECLKDNFLSQVIGSPTRGDVLLDQIVPSGSELMGVVKTGGSQTCSEDTLVKSEVLRDWKRGFRYTLSKCADDMKLSGLFDTLEGQDAIQWNLDELNKKVHVSLTMFKKIPPGVLHPGLWSPAQKEHRLVGGSQEEATKIIREMKHLSHQKRARELGLFSLEQRRLWDDLVEAFRYKKRAYKEDGGGLAKTFSDKKTRNNFKIKGGKFRLDTRKKCFTVRLVRYWNTLPREFVDAPSPGQDQVG